VISSESELAEFLLAAGREGGALERWTAGSGVGLSNGAACEPGETEALVRMAHRPPPGMVVRKFGSRSMVGSVPLPGSAGGAMLKYYYPPALHRRLGYTLAGSRCRQSWVAGLAFRQLGIPAPAPLAMAEWRTGGILISKSFLATRQVEGMGLDEFVAAHRGDEARLKRVAAGLEQAFSLMAHYRIAHGDLKAGNILVGDAEAVSFTDLDAVTFLASAAAWKARRAQDRKKFFSNWKNEPVAVEMFRKALGEG
jgi:tRNA A-37 threonylcarbamoyl transferase component Bud32